jgi:hypothetical protein
MRTAQEILRLLEQAKPELVRSFGVRHLAVLGSYARGEQREESEAPRAPARGIFVNYGEISSPLTGEDRGGGAEIDTPSPPLLTPPARGGEFSECHSSPCSRTGHPGEDE